VRESALRKSESRNTAVKKGELGKPSLKKNESRDVASRKGKNYVKKRADDNTDSKLQDSTQDRGQITKESKRGKNASVARGRLRSMTPELDSDFEVKEQQFTRGAGDRRSLCNVGTNSKPRKNPSVTFSPTVTCTADGTQVHTAQKTKDMIKKRISTHVHHQKRHVVASETSDTDSTTQELQMV